jgi:hypothetical protein
VNLSRKNNPAIKGLRERLSSRISIAKLFQSTPEIFTKDYGGELIAYSFESISVDDWFEKFRQRLLDAIGKNYLPVYRMADGEYQFLLGIKFNSHPPRIFRYLLSFLFRKTLELLKGPGIKTSWGETYRGKELIELRSKYIKDLRNLLECGIVCAYLYENQKNSHVHYNRHIIEFFDSQALEFNKNNLFPFHFPFFVLSNQGWQEFIINRNILIVSGNLENRRSILEKNLVELGSKKVGFFEISANSSLKDKIEKDKIENYQEFEIAFIGGGIGSLNIISQMKWFTGPVIDVGGFISVLQNKDYLYHGGAVKFPGFKSLSASSAT